MSINIVRNTEDLCGFGWIRVSDVYPSSVIVTERKRILNTNKKFQKCPWGTDLKYRFMLQS